MALQDASQLREEKTHLEKQTSELQAKCSELESDKFEAIQRARSSLQLLEEANLQKSQVRGQGTGRERGPVDPTAPALGSR